MPEEYRLPLTLRYLAGADYETIQVQMGLSNGSLRGVRLTIADTGSGIHRDVRSSMFEPFVSTKGDTGTGLGLWLSSEIVRKHGGTIHFETETGQGTCFIIRLPLKDTAIPEKDA